MSEICDRLSAVVEWCSMSILFYMHYHVTCKIIMSIIF